MRAACLVSASVGVLAVALAGCSTTSMVQSVAVADDKALPAKPTLEQVKLGPGYLTYFLPQTVLSVKLSAKKAATGGDDSKDDKAATSSSASVSNTITITGAKADEKTDKGDKPAAAGDKASPMSVCDQLKSRYDYLQATHAAFTIQRLKDLDAAAALALGPLSKDKERSDAQAAVDAIGNAGKVDNERVAMAWPLAAKFVSARCRVPVNVELSLLAQADTTNAYRLHMRDDSASADTFTLKLDSQGLLSSVATTADDKSGEVATGAAKSLGTVLGVVYSNGLSATPQQLAVVSAATHAQTEMTFAYVKPRRLSDQEVRTNLLAAIKELRRQVVVELPALAPSLPENPVTVMLSDALPNPGQPKVVQLGDTAYYLTVSCSPVPKVYGEPTDGGGLVTSAPRTCRVWVGNAGYQFNANNGLDPAAMPTSVAAAEQAAQQMWTIAALDSRYPIQAPLMRTRLVKRVQGYEFKDGAVTQVTYDKPSDGAAAVAVPGNLIGGLFSGISAGIQGRQGNYKDQAALLDAKASVLNSQAALIKAQADLEAARTPKATTGAADPSSK